MTSINSPLALSIIFSLYVKPKEISGSAYPFDPKDDKNKKLAQN
jgi:hypothetical protein